MVCLSFAELSWASASRLSKANITTIHQASLIHSILALIIGPITTLTFRRGKQPAIHHDTLEFLFGKNLLTLWPFGPLTPVDPRWPRGPWGHRVKQFTQEHYRKAVSCGAQVSQLPKILFMDPNFTSARVLIMWPTYWVMPLSDNGVVGGCLSKWKGGGANFSVMLGLCCFGKRGQMKTWTENKFKVNITQGKMWREKDIQQYVSSILIFNRLHFLAF